MKREIEFRAKKVKDNNWVYGYYHKLNESFEDKECILEHHRNTSAIVDATTLGQFTGLFDINGKKIYEGDVVRDYVDGRYEVVYDNQYMRFAFRQMKINWGMEGLFDGINECCEVLGNKYDHPYLLDDGGEL